MENLESSMLVFFPSILAAQTVSTGIMDLGGRVRENMGTYMANAVREWPVPC